MANLVLPEPDFKSELEALPMMLQKELNFDRAALSDYVFVMHPILNDEQKNLDPAVGHCNGTRYLVLNLHNHRIEAEVVNGTHAEIRIMILRILLTTTEDYPFSFSRKQFPIKPAFGITSNKFQSQTLETVGIHLPTPMFSHGQFYVANSRVGSRNNIHILVLGTEYKSMKGICTRNVVYKEIL
ncbi:uncharacterized protein LOC115217878 [Octopus sinensis]|uniref:Uncharacterized protein LOC115217878 n=1 Tax=Octopus sinensis TaxID=2607531 RepID=A0A6P7SZ70_9MOLL|nr:uncharacterized protein LOC115217878 [Octopus sinensis]